MGDIASYSIEEIARRLGGKVHRDAKGPYVLAPGPGHTAGDKSLSFRFSSTASADGFVVHSFAGDDPIVCRDYIRDRVGVSAFKPNKKASNTRHNGRGNGSVTSSQPMTQAKPQSGDAGRTHQGRQRAAKGGAGRT